MTWTYTVLVDPHDDTLHKTKEINLRKEDKEIEHHMRYNICLYPEADI
jgi:hypothetical protein